MLPYVTMLDDNLFTLHDMKYVLGNVTDVDTNPVRIAGENNFIYSSLPDENL